MSPDTRTSNDATARDAGLHGALRIALGRHASGDLAEGARREWLATTGHGDYALGTAAGLATRRYHGLLVGAAREPVARRMLVPFVDEELAVGRERVALATRRWADGTVDPTGHRAIQSFALEDGIPCWTFEAGAARLEKRVVLLRGPRAVAIVWTLVESPEPVALVARVFTEHRDHHALDPDADWNAEVAIGRSVDDGDATHARIDLPANRLAATPTVLWAHAPRGELSPQKNWWRRHKLSEEAARGYDAVGSAFHALDARWTMRAGESRVLVIAIGQPHDEASLADDGRAILAAERARRTALVARAPVAAAAPELRALVLASDAFVVERARRDGSRGLSILAGFPWFEDWGRDACIALPGLLLATGRARDAATVLETLADHLRDGLLPNRFPDQSDENEYHCVDAPLHFLLRCCETAEALDAGADEAFDAAPGGGLAWLRRMWPSMRAIVAAYTRGTRHGIRIADDGLVEAGEAGRQLTWMDAKIGELVVTPRIGKPVELSALWIDALRRMALVAPSLGLAREPGPQAPAASGLGAHDAGYQENGDDLAALAARAEASFARFWNPATQCLFDCLDAPNIAGGGLADDGAVRPNQLWALAARHSPLPESWRSSALAKVGSLLATPLAVRTLPRGAAEYRGRYEGDQRTRDMAYHNGTAWPFLTGLLLEAERISAPDRARRRAQAVLADLGGALRDGGLGSLPEIVDGDAPHEPRGCPMQAWSVGCMLDALARVLGEDPRRTTNAGAHAR